VSADSDGGDHVLALLLFLVLVWVVLGAVGIVVKGLFWLFVIACILFVITILGDVFRRGRRSARRVR
jgi:hypothetical protein